MFWRRTPNTMKKRTKEVWTLVPPFRNTVKPFAMQNYACCFFFWQKKDALILIGPFRGFWSRKIN